MITVYNSQEKLLTFPDGVTFFPKATTISDPDHIRSLRVNVKAFNDYCAKKIPGSRDTILNIVSGSLEDWVEGDPKPSDDSEAKGVEEATESPLIDMTIPEAIGHIDLTLDVVSLDVIISTEKRKKVKAAAQTKREEMRA